MKKRYFISLILILLISSLAIINFIGCGAIAAIVSAIFGSQGGFVFIPFLGEEKLSESQTEKLPGMIMLYTNNPPSGYKSISGASVIIEGKTVTTTDNGSFEVTGLTPGTKILKVEHPSYVAIEQEVPVSDPNSTGSSFSNFRIKPDSLLAPIGIGGTFQFSAFGDGQNGPVEPAATWSVEGDIGTVSSTGIFTATKTGTGKVKAVSGSDTASIDVTVVEGRGTVFGKVTSAGQPFSGAVVKVNNTTQYAISDGNGNYTLPGTPASSVTVTATAGNGQSVSATVTVPAGGQAEANLPFSIVIPTSTPAGPTAIPTATITPGGPTLTPTPTVTPGGPTLTPTLTVTPAGPTNTPTPASTPSWKSQNSGISTNLEGVSFVDSNNGWAVGSDGTILHTSNGGTNWTPQTSGTTNSLEAINFVDSNNGWAVGSGGTILHTSNGGTTWAPQTSGTVDSISDVSFVDSNNGWTAGDAPGFESILHTNNGGTTWTPQTSGTSAQLLSIHFIDLNNGWAAGMSGTISHTSNGGANWTLQTSGTTDPLYDIYFLDNNNGWLCGWGGLQGRIMYSSNGGGNWNVQYTPTSPSQAIYFVDNNNGWCVCCDLIFFTTNGGSNWNSQNSPVFGTGDFLNDICFVNSTTGWAVGRNGAILKYSP